MRSVSPRISVNRTLRWAGAFLLVSAIVVEAGVLFAERDMLRRITSPELAVFLGLGALAWLLLLVELTKFPFAALYHFAPSRWWRALGLVGTLIACVISLEAMLMTASKTHEVALAPALAAEAKRSALATEATRLKEMLSTMEGDSVAASAEREAIRRDTDTEARRLEAVLAERMRVLEAELAAVEAPTEDPTAIRLAELEERRRDLTAAAAPDAALATLDARLAELAQRRDTAESEGRTALDALRASRDSNAASSRAEAMRRLESRLEAAEADRRDAERDIDEAAATLAARLADADRASIFDRDRLRREARTAHDDAKRRAEERRAAAVSLAEDLRTRLLSLGNGSAQDHGDPELARREQALVAHLSALDAEREALREERERLLADSLSRIAEERTRLDAEIAVLAAAVRQTTSERASRSAAARGRFAAESAAARLAATTALNALHAERDRRLMDIGEAVLAPADRLRRTEETGRRLVEIESERTQLSVVAVEARRASPIVQIARVFSGREGHDPSEADIAWTLAWVVPTIAVAAALAPTLLLKGGFTLLWPSAHRSPRRRLRPLARLRLASARSARHAAETALRGEQERVAELERTAAEEARRHERERDEQAAEANRCAEEMRSAHATAIEALEAALERERAHHAKERNAIMAEHRAALALEADRGRSLLLAAQADAESQLTASAARERVADARSARVLEHAEAERQRLLAETEMRIASLRRKTRRRLRLARSEAAAAAEGKVLRTLTTQQGTIGSLSAKVEMLEATCAEQRETISRLTSLVDASRDENLAIRRDAIEFMRQIPTAEVTIDYRGPRATIEREGSGD